MPNKVQPGIVYVVLLPEIKRCFPEGSKYFIRLFVIFSDVNTWIKSI